MPPNSVRYDTTLKLQELTQAVSSRQPAYTPSSCPVVRTIPSPAAVPVLSMIMVCRMHGQGHRQAYTRRTGSRRMCEWCLLRPLAPARLDVYVCQQAPERTCARTAPGRPRDLVTTSAAEQECPHTFPSPLPFEQGRRDRMVSVLGAEMTRWVVRGPVCTYVHTRSSCTSQL